MISQELRKYLNQNQYLNLSTSSLEGKPNAAPMFLVKLDDRHIYCIDYAMGTTFRNLKVNPVVSISLVDLIALKGFKLNCKVTILKEGPQYEDITAELENKALKLTTQRVIDGVRKKIRYKNFELGMLEKFVIYICEVKEIVEIGPQGNIKKI